MGTAPYDAIPIIISGHLPKVPFKVIRIAFDFSVTMIGFSFGGKIGAMTVIMILALGPVIQWLGDIMKKHFPKIIAVTLGVAALAVSVYMFVTKDKKFHYRHAE